MVVNDDVVCHVSEKKRKVKPVKIGVTKENAEECVSVLNESMVLVHSLLFLSLATDFPRFLDATTNQNQKNSFLEKQNPTRAKKFAVFVWLVTQSISHQYCSLIIN